MNALWPIALTPYIYLGLDYFGVTGSYFKWSAERQDKKLNLELAPRPTNHSLDGQIKTLLMNHANHNHSEAEVPANGSPDNYPNTPDHGLAHAIRNLVERRVEETEDEQTTYRTRLRKQLENAELDIEAHRALNRKLSGEKWWAECQLSQLTGKKD